MTKTATTKTTTSTTAKTPFTVTRINNASVLIHIGDDYILTDPYFIDVPFIGVMEMASMEAKDLPPLTAILGCHDVIDHWQMEGLADYPHDKTAVQLFVAMEAQAKVAKEAGFTNVEVLEWGQIREVGNNGLTIESVKAQDMLKWHVNNYVIRHGGTSLFFGSEARDLPPLKDYFDKNGAVDMAFFPVNGVYFMTFYQLVMNGDEAVKGAKLLGAKQLFVIHDAHKSRPVFLPVKSSGDEADREAEGDDSIEVIRVPTGVVWSSETNGIIDTNKTKATETEKVT